MAAKRISSSLINWEAFAERVPEREMANFRAFKAKNSAYVRRVQAGPETLPKINWDYYRSQIAVPGLVDKFQKAYEGLNIPYPGDQGRLAEIDKQEIEEKKQWDEWGKEMTTKASCLKERLKELESLMPITEMTREEYAIAFPDKAVTPDNPVFWPHTEEYFELTRKLKAEGKLK